MFGEFLLEKGLIDEATLLSALDEQQRKKTFLGALGVQEDLLAVSDVLEILRVQLDDRRIERRAQALQAHLAQQGRRLGRLEHAPISARGGPFFRFFDPQQAGRSARTDSGFSRIGRGRPEPTGAFRPAGGGIQSATEIPVKVGPGERGCRAAQSLRRA